MCIVKISYSSFFQVGVANLKGELETGAENGSRLAPGEQVDLGAERALDTVELADRNVLELKYIFLKQTKKVNSQKHGRCQ